MKYAIVVAFSDEDEGYIATVPEFARDAPRPGIRRKTRFKEVKIAASLWLSAATRAGAESHRSRSSRSSSRGGFPLRLPGDLRRKLELEAKRKGVSLNQLILQRLA